MSNENSTLMLRGIARAVMELRRRKEWDQTQLAREFRRYGLVTRLRTPTQATVSGWETGSHLPSLSHRTALAKIAGAQKQHSLYEIFSAPPTAWRLLMAAVDVGIVIDPESRKQIQAMIEEYSESRGAGPSGKLYFLDREKSR